MPYHNTRSLLGVLAGIALISADASAASISWVLNAAVPLSPIALALMAAAFLGIGIWMLLKTRHMQQYLGVGLLLAGVYQINAIADLPPPISITTPSDTLSLHSGTNYVDNNYTEAVRITDINTTCAYAAPLLRAVPRPVMYPTCTVGLVLQPNASCQVEIVCGNF